MPDLLDKTRENNHFLLSIQSDPQPSSHSYPIQFTSRAMDMLYYSTRIVPLVSVIAYPVGMKASLSLRAVNDLLALPDLSQPSFDAKTMLATLKVSLSAASVFYAFMKPHLLQPFEISRTIFLRLVKLYTEKDTLNRQKVLQECSHLAADFLNLAIYSYGGLQLKLASHLFQLIANGFDIKEQKDEGSMTGVVVYSLHALLVLYSTGKIAHQINNTPKSVSSTLLTPNSTPKPLNQPSPTNHPVGVPAQIPPAIKLPLPPHIRALGTGSEVLSKFTFVRALGEDSLSGELFLVRDQNGGLHTLKRFYSETEKMEKSLVYAFINILLFPLAIINAFINPASRAMETGFKLSGVLNLLKYEQMIQNSCAVGEKHFTDNYILMEHFDGKALDKISQTIKKEPMKQLFHAIADTLRGALSKGYFFQSTSLDHIQVNKDLNQVKFTDATNFHSMTSNSSWESCMSAYRNIYEFLKSLIKVLAKNSKETKEKLLKAINQIFSHIKLAEDYHKIKTEQKEAVKGTYSQIFSLELLKTTVAQVVELFLKL